MNALDELKNKLRAGGGRSLTALELAVLFAREITVAEHERAAAELAALRARVGELEQERDELRNIVAAQIVEWKYRVENQPMPTDRLIGIDMCADELSAALAKGAK